MVAHSQAHNQPDVEGSVCFFFVYGPTLACEPCNYPHTPSKCASVVQLAMAQNGYSMPHEIPATYRPKTLITRTTFERLNSTFVWPEDRYGWRMKMAICGHALKSLPTNDL